MEEILAMVIAFAPFIITSAACIIGPILLFRNARRNETGKVRNTVIGILLLMVPALMYIALYILGRILTG
ncbi:MAG: hypothetical protein IJI05_01295 [Erysipelotrichaceae bacterium]|nr:hypothetical protein [Erysipelotrichaceae bacterium]